MLNEKFMLGSHYGVCNQLNIRNEISPTNFLKIKEQSLMKNFYRLHENVIFKI